MKELNLDPGVDTLGRWMAHHVAALINAAETEPSAKLKRERRKEACEAIQSLWAHRSAYENRINPLADLKPIIQAVRTLDPSNNVYVLRNEGTRYVYDIFRRLVICLLLRKTESLGQVSKAVARAKVTTKYQNDDERALVEALDFWLEGALTREATKAGRQSPKSSKIEKIDLDKAAQALIAEARKALDAASEEIVRKRVDGGTARPKVH